MPASPYDPFALARRSAVLALVVVVIEASAATVVALVPTLVARASTLLSAWALVTLPAVVAAAALGALAVALGARRAGALGPGVVVLTTLVAAVALGTLMGALGTVTASLRGAGLAFAAPLVVGEMFAAGAWLAPRAASSETRASGKQNAERAATLLSLACAAVTTCAAAWFAERLDVEMAPLAIAVGGVCAQVQLALARVGEGALFAPSVNLGGDDVLAAAGARLAAVPRSLVLAALGRSGPQGDP